jgi:hypothetical protein
MSRGKTQFEHYRNYTGGVNYRALPTELLEDQYRGGSNITLTNIGKLAKRGGRSKVNTSATSKIHSLYRYSRGTTTRTLVGAGTVLSRVNGTALTSVQTGMSGNSISFESFNDFCWIADGTNMYKYDMTNIRNWGIAAPTVAVTATVSGSAGTFSASVGFTYKYTYYNSSTGHESADSATASTGAFTNKLNVAVGYTASADAQVTHIRIYRTTDGGSTYYLLTTVTNATSSYNDTTTDATLQNNALFASDDNDPPVGARYVCLHKKRLFTLNQTSNTSRLAWSKINKPWALPDTYYEDIDKGYGGVGTGIVSFGDALVVAKTKVIWVIWGCENEDSINWVKVRQIENNGVIAPRSLIVSNGYIYFIGRFGYIYRMGADFNPVRISLDIDSLFDNVTEGSMADAVAVDRGNGKLYFSLPSNTNSANNDLLLEYDTQFESWHPYMKSKMVSAMAVANNENESNNWYSGDVYGFVRNEDTGNTDDSAGFVASVEGRYSHMGLPSLFKKVWQIATEATMSVVGDTVTVTPKTRTGFYSTHTITHAAQDVWIGDWVGDWSSFSTDRIERQMCAQGVVGAHIAVDATSNTSSGDVTFEGATLEYTVETT